MSDDFRKRYSSRKFWVTMGGMAMCFLLAMLDKDTGQFGLVAAAAIGSYNWANAFGKDK